MSDEYKAVVVRLPELTPLDGCDNVAGARFFGLQAIVSKDSVPGTLGVVFQAETKLSDEYLFENNLYREQTLNKNPDKKGYFETNGRVRAVKFRGHRSDCFWMPLESLLYVAKNGDVDVFEGTSFDTLAGHKICEKYIPKTKAGRPAPTPKEKLVDDKYFPQHVDTSNFFRNIDKIPEDALLVVTQKLHGTSVRIGNVPVRRKLTWKDKVAAKFGVFAQEFQTMAVAGSRRVVKDPNKELPQFYTTDIHSHAAKLILDKGVVPENYVLYGEIIGWTPHGEEIQKGYTYGLPRGVHETYIYRVAHINSQGLQQDLSWEQVKGFCKARGLKYVPELDYGHRELNYHSDESFIASIEGYLDINIRNSWPYSEYGVVPLEPHNPCDEGVVIRVEGLEPQFYKAKSPLFLQHETKMLDKGEVDVETAS